MINCVCVWHPSEQHFKWLKEQGIHVTFMVHREEDQKEVDWLGKHRHGYGHLAGLNLNAGLITWRTLETTVIGVTPLAVYNTGPRKLLAWCMLDTPSDQKDFWRI